MGRLDLGELAEVGQRQGLAVWLWQPPDQWFQAAGELLAALGFVSVGFASASMRAIRSSGAAGVSLALARER